MAGELRKLASKEHEEYNGKNGKPAYIAYKGKICDLSQSGLWIGGERFVGFQVV